VGKEKIKESVFYNLSKEREKENKEKYG